MNRTPGTLNAVAQGARWGLPWLGVLAVSASVAYAMTVPLAGGLSAADAPTTITVAQAPAVRPAAFDRFSSDEACDTSGGRTLYVGLNSWIPAAPKLAPCPESAP
jgi:hypothetical protein